MVQGKRSSLYNVASTLGLAFTIPWVVYRVMRSIYDKRTFRSLPGKVVVITGASSGLGEALAHEFYKAGCQVVLCSRKRVELERVRTELLRTHPTMHIKHPIVCPVDLSDIDSLPAVAEKILSIIGHVDILVNNAGVSSRGSVLETDINVDMSIMQVNYFGTVAFTKALLPSMIARRQGHIVAISSVQGLLALPHRSAYGASKHALQAFMDSLRAEVTAHGIHVTVISPGYVRTQLSLNALTATGETHGQMDKSTARGYQPAYVASQVLHAVAAGKPELLVADATARIGVWLRHWCPSLCMYVMAHRAKNEAVQEQ